MDSPCVSSNNVVYIKGKKEKIPSTPFTLWL